MGQRKKRKTATKNNNNNNNNNNNPKEKDYDSDSKEIDEKVDNSTDNRKFYDQYLANFCPGSEHASQAQAFQQFVAAGGQKCISFFQTLFQSWKTNGSLPPLSDEEASMLNHMYQLWLDNQGRKSGHDIKNSPAFKSSSIIHANSLTDPVRTPPGSSTVTLAALKEMVAVHNNETLTNLISQMEILLKSPEPTRTHGRELIEVLLSPEFTRGEFHTLEKRADNGDTSVALAMALLHDNDRPESNKRAVKLYLHAANKDNSIAAMQLGAKYLKGDGVRADSRVAFRWYLKAANMENPIAQHKLGYFYDEGLEGACDINIAEAVRCYSRASELMPDSMHNLAKIYEDGRGAIQTDMKQAVTLYSVAAARGFPLSQVNLGRLFLLGEDGVSQDKEAGKRLLTLAAESGDCDAQMVVGMIHATAAFDCCNLPLAEHWLRQSLAGGKHDAEKLLLRVTQQLEHQNTASLSGGVPFVSQDSKAAIQRGHDFLQHGLVHAAILEFTRAFVLDRTQLSPLVDRLEALSLIGHHDDCLADCLELLNSHATPASSTSSSSSGSGSGTNKTNSKNRNNNNIHNNSQQGKQQKQKQAVKAGRSTIEIQPASEISIASAQSPPLTGHLLDRVYAVLAGNIAELHGHSPSLPISPGTESLGPCAPFDFLRDIAPPHRYPVTGNLLLRLMDSFIGGQPTIGAARAAAYLVRMSSQGRKLCKLVVAQGGVPIIITSLACSQNLIDSRSSTPQQQMKLLHFLLPLWCDAAGILVNITKQIGLIHLIFACDGISTLVRLARRAMPHARVASAAIQALGNIAVLSEDSKAWTELLAGGIRDAFVATLTIPMDDLVDLPVSAKAAESLARGQGARWSERKDRLELLVVSILTLGRIMQVARGPIDMHHGPGPGDLARGLATSGTVTCLQQLFRSNILTAALRATTGFVLYKILCALDPGAPQMLRDSETRNEVREQLQQQQQNLKSKGDLSNEYFSILSSGMTGGGNSVVHQMFNRITRSLSGSQEYVGSEDSLLDGEPLSKEQRLRLLVGYSVDVAKATTDIAAMASKGGGLQHPDTSTTTGIPSSALQSSGSGGGPVAHNNSTVTNNNTTATGKSNSNSSSSGTNNIIVEKTSSSKDNRNSSHSKSKIR